MSQVRSTDASNGGKSSSPSAQFRTHRVKNTNGEKSVVGTTSVLKNEGDCLQIVKFIGKSSSQSPKSLRLPLNYPPSDSRFIGLPLDLSLYGRKKIAILKRNGWGYRDSYVYLHDSTTIRVHGNRYPMVCGRDMRSWHGFVDSIPGLQFDFSTKPNPTVYAAPQRVINRDFLNEIQQKAPNVEISEVDEERLFYGHGHTGLEIFDLRHRKIERLPDVVLFPKCHEDVERIVAAAVKHGVCLIPFGGGTSVTLGVQVPVGEIRMVATVSMSFMQRVLMLDRDAMIVQVEAGAVGIVLEQQLRRLGVTLGHEPDSFEFSTVGGWVATRASGMKKNKYGNIEDIVVDVDMVTSLGTFSRQQAAPRISSGPSLTEMVLGSEGTLGVITKVLLKIKKLPEKKVYNCLAFPSFEVGVKFCRFVALHRLQPASMRLMDPRQTQCGSLLKADPPGGPGIRDSLANSIKTFYIEKIKGWSEANLCACTLVYEGDSYEIENQQKAILSAARKFGAIPAGSKNGEVGYQMTFLIAYLRDFVMDHNWLFESFETSVPWSSVLTCTNTVKQRLLEFCKSAGIKYLPLIMVRLTQVYDAGAVLYFYFGFNYSGIDDPVKVYMQAEDHARHGIFECGGSLSHHHGVGKLRSEFLPDVLGKTGIKILRGVKATFDPQHVFGNGNLSLL